jgi:hypothetical protein
MKKDLIDFSFNKNKQNLFDLDLNKTKSSGSNSLTKTCQFCGKQIPNENSLTHLSECMEKNRELQEKISHLEKKCEKCGSNISNSHYILHEAQCVKNINVNVNVNVKTPEKKLLDEVSKNFTQNVHPNVNNEKFNNPFPLIAKNQIKPDESYCFRLIGSNSSIPSNIDLHRDSFEKQNSFMLIDSLNTGSSAKKEDENYNTYDIVSNRKYLENKISVENIVDIGKKIIF